MLFSDAPVSGVEVLLRLSLSIVFDVSIHAVHKIDCHKTLIFYDFTTVL